MDDHACQNGVHLRCPHCGQFTGGDAHTCPHFPTAYHIVPYVSGVVVDFHNPKHILATPHNPHYEAGKQPGYRNGRDPDGRDIHGRDGRGFDVDGYTPDGYDLFGRDRDGFDRQGFNNAGVNRHGERRPRDLETVLTSLEVGADPLAHKDLADLYGRIASGLVGQPRRVILAEGGGFATDMQGTIRADPYPLGRDVDPRHNLVVTRAGIYHELGHELFTPAEVWARVVAVAKSEETQEGLEAPARRSLPRFLNLVEDGRMERRLCDRYAGTAEVLSASCQIEPRWGETVGEGVPVGEQVFWSLLYTALPFYRLRPQVREAMSAPARKLFEELEPVVQRAVRGDAEEAYRAAVHLARRFQEEGLLDEMPQPERDYSQPEQPPAGGSSGRQGEGTQATGKGERPSPGAPAFGGQGSPAGNRREHSPAAGRPQGASGYSDAEKEDRSGQGESGGSGAGAGGEQDGDGMKNSDGSELRDPSERFTGADSAANAKAVLDAVEREASSALDTGLRARLRPDRIGRPLHQPLVSGQPSRPQQYRGLDGLPQTVYVQTPEAGSVELERRLAGRRSAQRKVAADMARTLKAIRQQAEQRLGRQASGRLDRRQLAGAVKGNADIYTRTRPLPETSFAASVAIDLSGSMAPHIHSGDLYDAAMTLGDTFEQLDVAYEVRGFGNRSAQFKAMDDVAFEPRRAACLAEMDMGGTLMSATCGLAASALLARPEKNRLFVCLTDGEANDHDQAVAQVQDARRRGIVCFGIFLGDDPDASKLDQLYGRGNWTNIRQLSDLPRLVGQRMASIFKSLRRQG